MGARPLRLFEEPFQRATVRIDVGRRTAWLHGVGLCRYLDELQVPRQWDWHPTRKGVLMCPTDRVGDLLALLEHRDKRVVELSTVDR